MLVLYIDVLHIPRLGWIIGAGDLCPVYHRGSHGDSSDLLQTPVPTGILEPLLLSGGLPYLLSQLCSCYCGGRLGLPQLLSKLRSRFSSW